MGLQWDDYRDIAAELENKYADFDLVNALPQEIHRLVHTLPDFDKSEAASDVALDAVRYAWVFLRDAIDAEDLAAQADA